jgi:hypothetical protein
MHCLLIAVLSTLGRLSLASVTKKVVSGTLKGDEKHSSLVYRQ